MLGINPSFVKEHKQEVVLFVAEGVYRALMAKYHPDKNIGKVIAGRELTLYHEAIEQVRADPAKCMAELSSRGRAEKESKQVATLEASTADLVQEIENMETSLQRLWQHIAEQKLGGPSKKGAEMKQQRFSYKVLYLGGLAIMVPDKSVKGGYLEHFNHNGVWFRRRMIKCNYSKSSPCPPDISADLIVPSSALDGMSGNYYDQSGPYEKLDNFELIGAYDKSALSGAQRGVKNNSAQDGDPKKPVGLMQGISLALNSAGLDSNVSKVLRPSITVGHVTICVSRTSDGHIRYDELGTITNIRTFDSKQRK